MKILITNLYLSTYSGSEVNCYELSRYFSAQGHEVNVFCFEKNEVFTKYFDMINITVCTDINELKYQQYDLIWAQHYVVLNVVLLSKINASRIVFSSLSPFETFEFPPIYANKLSVCLANSFETKQQLESNNVNSDNIYVFPNSVDFDHFKYREKNSQLVKIACVSNHPPLEIKDAEFRYLLEKNGMQIDYLGAGYDIHTLIDQDVLLNYDCIITIGKTVQYAMALKIPVYCYDHFGGPGWISKANIETAFRNNFSGRGFSNKSTGEIIDEIINGYMNSLGDLNFLYQFCFSNCNLQQNINQTLSVIEDIKTINLSEIQVDTFLFKRVFLSSRTIVKQINKSDFCQLFVDLGDGYSETNSIKSFNENSKYTFIGKLVYNNLLRLRFDPSNSGCVVSNFECCLIDESGVEHQCAILKCNANLIKEGKYYFETKDSQFHLSVPISNPRFFRYSFDIKPLEDSAYYQAYIEFNKYLD